MNNSRRAFEDDYGDRKSRGEERFGRDSGRAGRSWTPNDYLDRRSPEEKEQEAERRYTFGPDDDEFQLGRGTPIRQGERSRLESETRDRSFAQRERSGAERSGAEMRMPDRLPRRRSFAGVGPANYRRSDERIEEECHRLLRDDDRIDASNIELRVNKGTVTLRGSVPERAMKIRAEELLDAVAGVVEIGSEIRIAREDGAAAQR